MGNSILRIFVTMAALTALIADSGSAQSLEKRSRLELRLGMAVQTSAKVGVSTTGVETDAGTGGFLGSVGYSYWLSELWAISFSAGAMSIKVDTRTTTVGVSTNTATISQVLVGVRYYFVKSTLIGTHRPYFSIEMGPVVGSQSKVEVASAVIVEKRDQTTVGSRLGVGFDILLGHRWMLGLGGGYNLMADFSEEIAGRKNHSGPDFGASISFLFGGGK